MNPFQNLISSLNKYGLVEDARWIKEYYSETAYTTSSEMYGKLGVIIGKTYNNIPVEAQKFLASEFQDCEAIIKGVWGNYTLHGEHREL